jgi:rRNA-processing protein FCF1
LTERKNGVNGSDNCQRIVLDAAFIFDFETAQILALIFRLKHNWIITDFIEGELKTPHLPILKQLGLGVVTLTGNQVKDMHILAKQYVGPSINDLSCLVFARDNGVPLVTRDSALKKAARDQGVSVQDSHDVLMELVYQKVISSQDAADALETIQNERLSRPRSDWTRLIKQWRNEPASEQ